MGFFSFLTTDTKLSIPNHHSSQPFYNVYMVDDEGTEWEETSYEGYGVFGGKDIYQLIAEMNNMDTGNFELDRHIGINLHLGISGIYRLKEIYLATGIHFFNWDKDIITHGKSANQLIKEGSFKNIKVQFTDAIFPNLYTKSGMKWQNKPLRDCKYQGYFY